MPKMYGGQTLPLVFRDDIQLIQQSGQYLLGLINGIFDLTKIEDGKFNVQLTNTHPSPWKLILTLSLICFVTTLQKRNLDILDHQRITHCESLKANLAVREGQMLPDYQYAVTVRYGYHLCVDQTIRL
jgi:signal transduction histidine kinase